MKTKNKRYSHIEGKGVVGALQHAFALSKPGAITMLRAIGWVTFEYVSYTFPIMLVYLYIQNTLVTRVAAPTLLWQLSGLALILLSIMVFAVYKSYNSTYEAIYAESATMRISLAEKLRRMPLAFFDKHNASDITARIMSDTAFLEQLYSHFLAQLFASVIMVILGAIGLNFLDWRLTLALLGFAPLVLLLFAFSIKLLTKVNVRQAQEQLAVNEKIEEGINNVLIISSYGQKERYLNELDALQNTMERGQMRTELVAGTAVNVCQALVRLGLPILIVVGTGLYLEGAVDMPTLLFFILISSVIFDPLSNILMNSGVLAFAGVKARRMNEIYELPTQGGATEFKPEEFTVELQDVAFAYEDGTPVLSGVSFTARQGETTALIGPSGSGKSTCARLIARFWDCQTGKILLGGVDISGIDPETLLRYYSIVFQDVVLFNNSIKENIRIGRRDASDEEVLAAARLAQCDGFVSKMPQGYDTPIGENGSRLSGGERQRISIARAILKDAPIVILDEATASQDAENETQIQQALSHLVGGKTVIIIAHRMRTIANVDRIVVLEEGHVSEMGSPRELYAAKGIYYSMVETQRNRQVR